MTEIRITGLAELERKLKALPARLAGRALATAMRAGGREIQREIKARAPVDTGAIRRNVVAKRGQRKFDGDLSQRQIIGVRHGRARVTASKFTTKSGKTITNKLTAYDRRGEDPFYFRFQELGYHAVGRRKAGSRRERGNRKAGNPSYGRFVPGQRFMREGLRAAGPRALVVIRTRLAAEIERLT